MKSKNNFWGEIKMSNFILPYETNYESIIKFLEATRKKDGDEKGIKAIYNGARYGTTKVACEILGLINNNKLVNIGRELAYGDDDQRSGITLALLFTFPPYEHFLTYISQGNLKETESSSVVSYWGKNGYGNSENNREKGVTVFFSLLEQTGLCKYIVGRGDKKTRIQWAADANERIENFKILQDKEEYENNSDITGDKNLDLGHENVEAIHKEVPVDETKVVKESHISTTINITIDMTEWADEKIQNFFNLLGEIDVSKP